MGAKHRMIFVVLAMVFFGPSLHCGKQPDTHSGGGHEITRDMKCRTCGMRVFDFKNWHTQVVYADGTSDGFCAVKCLMAYYFEPEKYSGKSRDAIKGLYAKDYYTLQWHDMKTMYFVQGSDVLGPMGHDLVPFAERAKAETFLDDHNGSGVYAFDAITPGLVGKLRMKKGRGL